MSNTIPEAEFDLGHGARLKLYSDGLVHEGGLATVEILPYAHLASVRVAFERDMRKLKWAIGLGVAAAVLAALSGPMQNVISKLIAHAAGGGSQFEPVLIATLNAVGAFARLLPTIALVLGAIGIAFAVVFGVGRTNFTLAFAATERSFSKLGRNRQLIEFVEILGARLAERGTK